MFHDFGNSKIYKILKLNKAVSKYAFFKVKCFDEYLVISQVTAEFYSGY